MASLNVVMAVKKQASLLRKKLSRRNLVDPSVPRSPGMGVIHESRNFSEDKEDSNQGLLNEKEVTTGGALEILSATSNKKEHAFAGESELTPTASPRRPRTREERNRLLTTGIFSSTPEAATSATDKLRRVAKATMLASKLGNLFKPKLPEALSSPLNAPSSNRFRRRTIVQPNNRSPTSRLISPSFEPDPVEEPDYLDDAEEDEQGEITKVGSEVDGESDQGQHLSRLSMKREVHLHVSTDKTSPRVGEGAGTPVVGDIPSLTMPVSMRPSHDAPSAKSGMFRVLSKGGRGVSFSSSKKSSKVVPVGPVEPPESKIVNVKRVHSGKRARKTNRIFTSFASPTPRYTAAQHCMRNYIRRYAHAVVHPRSMGRFIWEFVVMRVLILLSAWLVPLRVAFGRAGTAGYVIMLMLDVVFFADIFVCYFTAVRMPTGQLNRRPKYLMKYYSLRWLPIMLAYCIPWDVLVEAAAPGMLVTGSDVMYFSDIVLLLHLLRVARLSIYKERFPFQSLSTYRISVLMLQFTVVVVLVACTWHILGVLQSEGNIFFGKPWVQHQGIVGALCSELNWGVVHAFVPVNSTHFDGEIWVPEEAVSIAANASLSLAEAYDAIVEVADASFRAEWLSCTMGNATRWDPSLPGFSFVPFNSTLLSPYSSQREVNAAQMTKVTTALYWSMTTLTTVGYGDISPTTTAERVLAIVTMITGAITTAVLFGNVGLAVTRMDNLSEKYRQKVHAIGDFAETNELDDGWREHLLSVFEGQWMKTAGGLWLPPYLPRSLRAEVAYYQYHRSLEGVTLLKGMSRSFIGMLALRLQPQFFGQGDYLYREGDNARDGAIYILREGMLSVVAHSEEGEEVALSVIQPFSIVGHAEVALEMGQRQMTLKTLKPCSMLALESIYLWDALFGHPEDEDILIEDAERTLLHNHQLMKCVQKQGKRRLSTRDVRGLETVQGDVFDDDASGGASTSFASEEEGWDCMHQSVAELEKQIAYFQTQVIPQLDKMEGDYDKMLNSIPASS
eukprot:CAMPEP_0113873892 /NCGR_PEP_ID=MMETSP0780_2-20120614/4028_1 /TAXON_ID=652834 /ORGANISM="Palpitomonas bilix" /LENGTH=1012 /DNA_ID=CAMNT_0000859599 /DNA_START=363 /DNA_END=3401 /DNA_ORIENTATION=- /assembly_acc=CAM_ASM_000599